MRTIPCFVRKDYFSIISRTSKGRNDSVIMTYLTEKEEHDLDEHIPIEIERGGVKFNIEPDSVLYYGEIDFDSDEDLNLISHANWFNNVLLLGYCLPANYDYDKHCCYSPKKVPLWYDTVRPDFVAQYLHGCLGKPKRSLIFNHVTYGKSKKS